MHGHEPNLFESMIESVNEPSLIEAAKAAGAKGINLAGMCCSGAEVLVRHAIPHAGNFMSTEAILVTGAVDAAGLTTPEASHLAGPGLQEVCETVGMPPVLGIGSCVDNSRILIAAAEMVRTGGLGDSIADLPVAGCAPEYMSEKAISIGHYFVASGVYTVFGVTFPIVENTRFHKHLFEELEKLGMGKWGFAVDPYDIAHLMIAHIDKKRKELSIDKARERILMDMSDRRDIEAA